MSDRQPTCEERIQQELQGRLYDLRTLWNLHIKGEDEADPELGTFYEYGLCFDYVPAQTFKGQERGYFRYQLSWGGPSDEFRFYLDMDRKPYSIEYWFLDWFDGASLTLTGRDFDLLAEILEDLDGMGMLQSEYSRAVEG